MILPSTQRGGVEAYALSIASVAVNEGWEVHAAFPKTEETTSLIHDLEKHNVHYHHLKIAEKSTRKWESIGKHYLHFFRTLYLLLQLKPNVTQVILPWPDHCLGSILACGLLKIPTAVVFQLVPFLFEFSNIRLKLYTWTRARNQQWIAVSKQNIQLICKSFKINSEQVLCIYNGTTSMIDAVNLSSSNTEQLRYQVRQELGLSENSKLAVTVGRLDPQKGYIDIIPAIPYIIKEFPNVRFVWIGDGKLRESLKDKVREQGVENYVLFTGYCSNVPKLLKAADLFVFPTHYEGQPFALLEAMAHSLPIVASDASAIPEVIENRVHGLLFCTGDSCDLLENLRWALRNPDFMQQLAQNAQLRVQEFSQERMLKQTLSLLRQLSCVYL